MRTPDSQKTDVQLFDVGGELQPWPFYGYAPGNYIFTCCDCHTPKEGEKRSHRCLECAIIMAKRANMAYPAGDCLRDLAVRLTPNPALTVDGTLAIILDGIDRLSDEWLARALAYVNARGQGMAAMPVTDEQWKAADLQPKLQLLHAARSLKEALREASKL